MTTNNKVVRVVLMACLVPSAFTENRQYGHCLMLEDAEAARAMSQRIPHRFFSPILLNCQFGIG